MDSYEVDDTPEAAFDTPVNFYYPLTKNSHENSNPDWSRIETAAGASYTATVEHTDAWYYGPSTLSVYSASDLTVPVATVTEAIGVNEPMIVSFTAAYSGSYYILYNGREHYRFGANEVYTIAVTSP